MEFPPLNSGLVAKPSGSAFGVKNNPGHEKSFLRKKGSQGGSPIGEVAAFQELPDLLGTVAELDAGLALTAGGDAFQPCKALSIRLLLFGIFRQEGMIDPGKMFSHERRK